MKELSELAGVLGGALVKVELWLGILAAVSVPFIVHRIKLPKVRAIGGAGGGTGSSTEPNGPFTYGAVTIYNDPYFMGYPINRRPLFVTAAALYDPEEKRSVSGLLRWGDGIGATETKVEILPGDKHKVNVYGTSAGRIHVYVGPNFKEMEKSETLIKIGQTKEFEIRIRDKLRKRPYRIKIKLSARENRQDPMGFSIDMRTKKSFDKRYRDFKRGFRRMIDAFTSPGY